MLIRFTPFHAITLILMAATLAMGVTRLMGETETNWPLLYYAALVGYMIKFEGSLDNYWVLAGVICALLLRFEALGGILTKAAKGIELIVFGYVLWRGAGLLD